MFADVDVFLILHFLDFLKFLFPFIDYNKLNMEGVREYVNSMFLNPEEET